MNAKPDAIEHEAEMNAKDWPAFPMRQESGDEHKGMTWERPTQQARTVDVLRSNERPNLTAVYGTTVPPKGLSGALRRFAFNFSESNGVHWVALIAADRLQMVEATVDDLRRGHVPNLFAEMGLKAELKHNPKRFAMRVGTYALAGIGLYLLLKPKPRPSHRSGLRRR
jgi:hypothetical protein